LKLQKREKRGEEDSSSFFTLPLVYLISPNQHFVP
jgi:hypothetical protein